MIEIFKTNIQQSKKAKQLIEILLVNFPDYKINIDLSDCDKILRVESTNRKIAAQLITDLVKQKGFDIEILPD
jgi:hypothetical protein